MKTLLFVFIILITACAPIIQKSRGSANEIMIVLTITTTGIELSDQGNFTILAEYIECDSVVFLHLSGTNAQVVNKKDLRLLKGLIYKSNSGHDNYK